MSIIKLADGLSADGATGLFGPEPKAPLYTIKLKGDKEIRYRTAAELGHIVGSSGIKFSNPYDPINTEYDEFDEAMWAAQAARK